MLQVTTTPEGATQHAQPPPRAVTNAITPAHGMDNGVMDVLENTLWNRQLGVMSEEIVAALVCQIFEGEFPNCQTSLSTLDPKADHFLSGSA